MQGAKMKLLRHLSITIPGLAGLLFASSAYATCPPIVPCKTTAEASTIAGSNADQELITFAQDITTSTNEVAAALIDMANANSTALNQSAQNLVATNAELSQIQLNQELKVKKTMSDRKMAFDQQMTETAYRATTTVVSADDTKEEFQLILDTLSENLEKSVPEIILVLKETMDKNDSDGKVLVQIESSKGACSEDDVSEDGKCAISKRVYPGAKLQTLFKMCSIDKRVLKEKEKKAEALVAATQEASKKTAKALKMSDASASVGARMEEQLSLSCSPSQFKDGLCGKELTPEKYQEDIIIGNIIPNGDVSSSNFSSPAASSAQGFITDLSDEAKKEIEQQSLNREPLQLDPNQRVIPLNKTYRNANQVKAAMHFVDNIVADDLVQPVSPTDRRKISSAQYQSRSLSRIASLSAVRMVFMVSMFDRVGDEMRKMILNGDFDNIDKFAITADSKNNKESVLGASPLDVLEDRVGQLSSNLQLGTQNSGSANTKNDFVANPSKPDALEKINESLALQNDMMVREIIRNDQSIILDAISVAQKANSPEMIELMSNLRRGN